MFENLLPKWSWECILAICLDNRWVRVALSSKQFSWWYHWPRGSTVEQLVENDDQPIAVTPGSSQGSQRPHQLPRWPTRVTWQKARSQHMQVKILCWACCFDCYDCRESWVTLGIFLRRKMSNRAGQGWKVKDKSWHGIEMRKIRVEGLNILRKTDQIEIWRNEDKNIIFSFLCPIKDFFTSLVRSRKKMQLLKSCSS